jgi:predicted phage tail protein
MKHVNKKLLIRGAGKGAPKPEPAILNPPKLGGFKSTASYSVAEIIDLISDGPIDGLVDQNGALLEESIFKGIYLDNTPIQNTESLNPAKSYGSLSIANLTNAISSIYIENEKFKTIVKQPLSTEGVFFAKTKLLGIERFATTIPLYEKSWNNFLNISVKNPLPAYWGLADNKIEIHYASPIVQKSAILNSFQNHILNESKNNKDSIVRSIAKENIKTLDKIKSLMSQSNYVSNKRIPGLVNTCFIIIDLSNQKINLNEQIQSSQDIDFSIKGLSDKFDYVYTLTQPVISNNQYTGDVKSIVIIAAPLRELRNPKDASSNWYYFSKSLLKALNKNDIQLQALEKTSQISNRANELFNFSNVSCQFKNGEEFQSSLSGFDKVINDYAYEAKLLGPFVKSQAIQRIVVNNKDTQFRLGAAGLNSNNLSISQTNLIAGQEGSNDQRAYGKAQNNYSDWNNDNEKKDYNSLAVTHTVENPFVDKVSLSIVVNSLSDTIHVTTEGVKDVGKLEAGAKIPSIVAIKIETGKITNGEKKDVKSYSYSIVGLIEGACIIDFGADYSEAENLLRDSVKLIDGENLNDANLTRPFDLPSLNDGEDPSTTKRYIKVVKLSCETNSTLINKEISLGKVTEIIDQRLSYPFSAIAGIKLDARAFGAIPERSYDCKLKKVKIPSNYKIIDSETRIDIRYVKSAKDYTTTKQIYEGDWDGSFTEGWTDNPAWILYDLLTSKRYGLGAYIDEAQVNKWELYKIARFCDAVDDEGYFIGVSDGVGGLEPRFSCNILFKEQTKVYDAINVIANLFRGIVFFGGSEIHFLDDRPRTPIALFNNANAKDGIFNYSNVRRDLQFNTVEVVYLDRFDNYKTKVEYIQDEQDIRKRGVFKTTINTSGVTSRAMARRIGQHIIYQTTKENQSVDFSAGLEALLCRPGDLIIIEDEMKTRATNYGRVLDVDLVNKKLRIDNQFISGEYTGFITLYTPTGYSTSSELEQLATTGRQRVEQFSITGLLGNSSLSGLYKFSGYTDGFANSTIYPYQFPAYTGTGSAGQKLYCYYNTGATGFVFATGLAFQNNDTYDKVITNTGVFYGADISPLAKGDSGNYTGFAYSSGASNKRGATTGQISGAINWDDDLYPVTNGILDREINAYNISQITKISLTGHDNTVDYGSVISLNKNDPNVSFLPAVKAGSVYRIERTSASDQIYKIISIRENSQNEYGVTASRYDTGKFDTIEKAITQDFLENTYYTGVINVGNAQIKQLATPSIATFSGFNQTSSNFKLTGQWASVASATGYSVSIDNSLAGYFESTITNQTGVQFTGLTNIGNWTLSVAALAESPNINSSTATTGTFVAYSGTNTTSITKPAIVGFSLQ